MKIRGDTYSRLCDSSNPAATQQHLRKIREKTSYLKFFSFIANLFIVFDWALT
jgi:hypothetical protein